MNDLEKRLQTAIYLNNILLDFPHLSAPLQITFEWRRNSDPEIALNDQDNIIMIDLPPKPKKIFYRTTHNLNAP